jgi:hypothetical protein
MSSTRARLLEIEQGSALYERARLELAKAAPSLASAPAARRRTQQEAAGTIP